MTSPAVVKVGPAQGPTFTGGRKIGHVPGH